ncbi:hypothetical protein PS6_009005 [Mucor atramentarius]
MFNNLPQDLQSMVFAQLYQNSPSDFVACRAVCKQWNSVCMQILHTRGTKVSLTSKRQSKQFLHLLKKGRDFNSVVHHITFEGAEGSRELPLIEEFKFDDPAEVYSSETMLISSWICSDIAVFRRSVKHLHVVLDFVDIPVRYRNNRMLKDDLCNMPSLKKITARYLDIFPANVFIEDILNSRLQKLESVELAGIGSDLTSKRVYYVNPVENLCKLEIFMSVMDVNVLRYIEQGLPNLKDLCLLSNKANYYEWMTVTGDNPIQTFIIIRKFRDYCVGIPTVLVSLADEFFTLFAHIHQESFKKIDYVWDLLGRDNDNEELIDPFDD